jgi:HemK-like putative methylase
MKEVFLGCRLGLSRNVFRPRPETEFWVGKAISRIKKQKEFSDRPLRVLDMFAGSGCIGLAFLKNLKEALVDFVEIDEKAAEQIKVNLALNGFEKSHWRLYLSDLFEAIGCERYDIIFANPPYVALERIDEVEKEVLENEPAAALFAGRDGLEVIRRFFSRAAVYLKAEGLIFLEFDPEQKTMIEEILTDKGFSFKFFKDQFNRFRWLEASLKPMSRIDK